MLLSIVIVSYNNGDELVNCLDSIFRFNDLGSDLEVIVVDNSPGDVVSNLIGDYQGIRILKNPKNGFGRANNIGFDHSIGEHILFLNPDTLITDYCFRKMIQLYESDNSIGMAGFRLINAEGKESNSYNIRFNYGILKKTVLHLSRRFHFFIPRLMYTCGADILTDRNTFSAIGKFDDDIFMYGEEEDIAARLNCIGKKVMYFPEITIVHLQGKSSGHKDLANRIRMLDSCYYLCNKQGKSYKNLLNKEVRYMKAMNFAHHVLRKQPRYSKEIVDYYKNQLKKDDEC